MTMSKDRVEFTLERSGNNAKLSLEELKDLVVETLGMSQVEATNILLNTVGTIIRCRPSQFARFIIRRMEIGETHNRFTNGIKELRPKLIKPDPEVTFLDVSKRPASHDE